MEKLEDKSQEKNFYSINWRRKPQETITSMRIFHGTQAELQAELKKYEGCFELKVELCPSFTAWYINYLESRSK